MKRENAEAIINWLWDNEVDAECELREDYSGRGMHGEETTAIVTDEPGAIRTAMQVLKIKDSCRQDNMGKYKSVVY